MTQSGQWKQEKVIKFDKFLCGPAAPTLATLERYAAGDGAAGPQRNLSNLITFS